MVHLPHLITDLSVILITAALMTILFKYLKQPVVLGYLVAGFMVSPHVSFLPSIHDLEGIKVWAEIGVIFLLFSLGLEFSFRRLMKVGTSASITAIFEILFMMGAGSLTGYLLGWSLMDSIFLGGILSISSTTIIIRALDELGMKKRGFVSLVFATLIVEDLVAIVLLVLLSALAATAAFSGEEFLLSAAKLPFFMILWFVAGMYLLPTLFRKTKKLLSDETLLILSIGLCLGMVILATYLGFSPALGAFVMGSLIAETREGRKVEHVLLSVRDLFAAVFFVSVGALIEPAALKEHWALILLLTVITIFGKIFSTSLGALLSGRNLKHSVQAGFSLAQIGEFSFIIATLGVTLNVTSSFLYPVAVAVSAITTFTTPYLIRFSDPFYLWLEKRLPNRFIEHHSHSHANSVARGSGGFFSIFLKNYGALLTFNSVIVIAISFACQKYLTPFLISKIGPGYWAMGISGMTALILSAPFLWAIAGGRKALQDSQKMELSYNYRIAFMFIRLLVLVSLLTLTTFQSTGFGGAAALMIFAIPIIFFLGNRYASAIYESMESRFRKNLKESHKPEAHDETKKLAPWDATLVSLYLSPDSLLVGKTLIQAQLKETFGITVIMIERGSKMILTPQRDDMLFPHDRLLLLGNEDQIEKAQVAIEASSPEASHSAQHDYQLVPLKLYENSHLVGVSIRQSSIRELTRGLVVGIERQGKRILNPDSATQFQAGDLIWLVADRNRLKALRV